MATTSPTIAFRIFGTRSVFDRVFLAVAAVLFAGVLCTAFVGEGLRQPMRPMMAVVGGLTMAGVIVFGVWSAAAFYDGDRAAMVRAVVSTAGFAPPRVWAGHRTAQAIGFAVLLPVAWVALELYWLLPTLADLMGITAPVGQVDDRDGYYAGIPAALAILSIAAAVTAEELVFRAPGLAAWNLRQYITNRVSRTATTSLAVVGGWLWSSLAFGFLHSSYGDRNVLTTAILGAAMYPLTLVTRSLWPAIVTHILWNLIAFGVLPIA